MIEYAGSSAEAVRQRRRAHGAEALSFARRLDWLLVGTIGALVAYGLWVIEGITRHDVPGEPRYYVLRQAVFVGMGAFGLVVALALDPDRLRRWKQPLYAVTVGAMLFVFVAGTASRGSTRWIDLGFYQLQPSEFGKLFLVLFLGAFLADRSRAIGQWSTIWAAVGLASAPAVFVFLQPDFGTALVYGAALAATLFVSGVRWLHLAVLASLATVLAVAILWALPAAGVEVLKPYQAARLTAFTDPDRDPGGTTYNVNQSILAVGAGGLRGRGVDNATQTNLDYLPEHATDFAFASLAEQRGFVGASILLCLYLLLLWRGIRIVSLARDAFCAVVAGGIVFALTFQIFVNVGMTMGIAPITGIPLPFVSVGGSSMVSNLLAMGVLLSIGARGRER
jgi:rod shape determining protein RodA